MKNSSKGASFTLSTGKVGGAAIGTYSAYGNSCKAALHLLSFNGEPYVHRVEGYLLGDGHRLYKPALMRFCKPDTLSPFGAGGINSYSYCIGDPVNHTDPSGQSPLITLAILKAKYMRRFEKGLNHLPNEIIDKIVRYLPDKDQFALSHTSQRLRTVVKDVNAPSISRFHSELGIGTHRHMANLLVFKFLYKDIPQTYFIGIEQSMSQAKRSTQRTHHYQPVTKPDPHQFLPRSDFNETFAPRSRERDFWLHDRVTQVRK